MHSRANQIQKLAAPWTKSPKLLFSNNTTEANTSRRNWALLTFDTMSKMTLQFQRNQIVYNIDRTPGMSCHDHSVGGDCDFISASRPPRANFDVFALLSCALSSCVLFLVSTPGCVSAWSLSHNPPLHPGLL